MVVDAQTGRRWLFGRIAAGSVALLLSATCGFRLTYNTTPSLPIGIYRIVELRAPPGRGEFVGVCLEGETARLAIERAYVHRQALEPYVHGVRCPSGAAVIGKPVAGVPGDTVALDRHGVWINGSLLPGGPGATRDSRGRSMPRPGWARRVLGRDEYWLQSTYSPKSFDSRYFGPVRKHQIVDLRTPVRTLRRRAQRKIQTAAPGAYADGGGRGTHG